MFILLPLVIPSSSWGLVAQDGTVLYGLLEVLSKQSLAVLGKVKPERNKIKKIANMNIVWK